MIKSAPAWLVVFMAQVGLAYDRLGQTVEWRWQWVEGTFEVVVFPKLVEIEGAWCLESDIRVDVLSILALFDSYGDVSFSLVCDGVDCVHIDGKVGGNDVWLRLLNNVPGDTDLMCTHAGGSFAAGEP